MGWGEYDELVKAQRDINAANPKESKRFNSVLVESLTSVIYSKKLLLVFFVDVIYYKHLNCG